MPNDESAPDQRIVSDLLKEQAVLPPRLFYDRLGSTLFTAICQVPEYYPTRTEAAIFAQYSKEIALRLNRPFRLVDLGAGDCKKAAGLIPTFEPIAYTPVDISGDFLEVAAAAVAADFPQLAVEPLVRDFTMPWQLPDEMNADNLLFFYPGSSLGNFNPQEAIAFLKGLRRVGQKDKRCQLLLGLDTVKASDTLEAAYDDALGVTAAFNRNTLLNTNRAIQSDFNVADWDHRAVFNTEHSRIEMHLIARHALTVSWPGGQRQFDAGESIHTENSHKYTVASLTDILQQAGFSLDAHWTDSEDAFLVALAS